MWRALWVVAVSCLAVPATRAQEDGPKRYPDIWIAGMTAYEKGDDATALDLLEQTAELAPGHPAVMYALARVEARLGRAERALRWLEKAANVGASFEAHTDSAFVPLRGTDAFETILKTLEANRTPRGYSTVAFTIPEKDLIPEGIAYDPRSETLFVSSTYKRKIVAIDVQGRIRNFTEEKQDGLWGVVGMEVDRERGVLWANSCNAGTVMPLVDFDAASEWSAAVHEYDVRTGKLLQRHVLPNEPHEHFLNDLTVSSGGDVYITDSRYGAVFVIRADVDELELFYKPERLAFPNGIALSPDERQVFVAHAGGILSIDVETRDPFPVAHPEDVTVNGIDGLATWENSLIAHQPSLGRVVRFFLSEGQDRIVRAEVLEAHNPHFDGPTTGAVAGDRYFYIANSQLRRFDENGDIFPVDQLDEVVILKLDLKR
ncbi:MAG: SMP-30/gluconolactonase/LRE family protein [Candidatus Krumholzibacteriia bacterium]